MATAPIKHTARLFQTIIAGGVAIFSVNSDGLVWPSNLQSQADPIIAAFDDSDAAQAAADNLSARSAALDEIDNNRNAELKLLRASAAVLVDEINNLRDWITSFKVAVAGASTLANLKTAVAALPDMPDRTLAQAVTAIKNKITGGSVD